MKGGRSTKKEFGGRNSTEQYMNSDTIVEGEEERPNYECTYFYFELSSDVVNLRRRFSNDPGSLLSIKFTRILLLRFKLKN